MLTPIYYVLNETNIDCHFNNEWFSFRVSKSYPLGEEVESEEDGDEEEEEDDDVEGEEDDSEEESEEEEVVVPVSKKRKTEAVTPVSKVLIFRILISSCERFYNNDIRYS